jgi:hypothetical protein
MAKLNSGTRIYGTANVDTSIGIGGNLVVNNTTLTITGNTTTAPTAIFQGANVIIGNSSITGAPQAIFANSLGNTVISTTSFVLSNSTAVPFTANLSGLYHTGVINAASHTTGAPLTGTGGITANVTTIVVGNNTINTTITSAGLTVNGTAVIANSIGVYSTGTINAASHTVGTSFIANSTQLTTTYPTVHTANVTVNGAIIANATSGTAGQVLTSAGTGNVYWSTASGGGGGFTNGQSISVANLAVTGSLTAGASVGTSGQALVSTGTGVQWGALSPGYNYSSQFGGGNQYLGITASNAAFGFGTGEFTIEGWFYPTLNPANGVGTIFEFRVTNNASALTMRINTSLQLVFYDGGANVETAFTTRTVSLNAWQHVAFVRIGNTVYGYINGLLAGSVAVTSNLGSSQPFYIGTNQTAGYNYYGLISNVRVIKGTGIYTGAFTPPTSPLSAISGTSVLTCNAITPTSDSSTNAFQFTNGNGVTTTATLSPFTSTTVSIPTASLTAVRQQFTGDGSTTTFAVAGGYTPNAISVFVNGVLLRNGTEVTVTNGSTVVFAIAPLSGALIDVIGTVPTTYSSITPVGYSVGFNGSSQYLSATNNPAYVFGTGNFTVELWLYPTSVTASTTTKVIMSTYQDASNGWTIGLNNTNNSLYVSVAGDSATITDGSGTIAINQWYHIALVRNGTTLTLYKNGVSIGTPLTNSTNISSTSILSIGASTGGTLFFPGYISNARITKGVAVYTNNFTVPPSPLAAVQSASGAYIQAITGTQTSLLTCNGPTIIDGSTNAFTITNNGSAPVSTSIVPTFTNVTITNPITSFLASYLVVAGGGSGGATSSGTSSGGGGGGAGGALTGLTTFTVGLTYYITVGAGGASTNLLGNNGANSQVVNFSTFSIVAIGGGGGGGSTNAATVNGQSGGSGGGGGNNSGANAPGGSGTSGQGYAGGTLSGYAAPNYPGAGGGGAGAVGTSVTSATVGGNGGAGISSSITGTSITYAGGGGGSTYNGGTPGTGGSGGGGAGATGATAGTAGTVNTGGGGGGAAQGSYSGAGGSGVVILSIPTANYTGTTTGSPTITTNGIYTVLKFTASGTYTA